MKSTGVIRRTDELGRIVIPIEFRRILNIEEKDLLEIRLEEGALIIRKYEPSCVFCSSLKDISFFNGKNICGNCLGKLKEF